MNIEYVPKIDGTPIMPFVIDAYISLRQKGNIEVCDCPATGAEEAFYIRNNRKKIVAVLSFWKSDSSQFTINMGYVLKPYRKRGYYRALWDRMVEEARSRNISSIIGYHKSANAAILAFNEKVGRRIKYVCSEFVVE